MLVHVKSLQLCPTLCDPWTVACQAPLSFSQARILEWVDISSSKGSSWPRNETCLSCIGMWVIYHSATYEALSGVRVGICRLVFFPKQKWHKFASKVEDWILFPVRAFWLHLTYWFWQNEISNLYQNDTSFLTMLENKGRNKHWKKELGKVQYVFWFIKNLWFQNWLNLLSIDLFQVWQRPAGKCHF